MIFLIFVCLRQFFVVVLWVDHEKLLCLCFTTFLTDEKVAGRAVGRPPEAEVEGEPIGMYVVFSFCPYYPCTIVCFVECSFVVIKVISVNLNKLEHTFMLFYVCFRVCEIGLLFYVLFFIFLSFWLFLFFFFSYARCLC